MVFLFNYALVVVNMKLQHGLRAMKGMKISLKSLDICKNYNIMLGTGPKPDCNC
jgi:hypothetical protein